MNNQLQSLRVTTSKSSSPETSRVGNVFLPTIDDEIFLLPQAVGKKACPPYSTENNDAKLHAQTTHQSGAVLVISLIMLLLLTLIGTSGMQATSLEEKMAGNLRDKNLAFQAAESALKAGEASLNPLPAFTDAGTNGFYSQTSTIPTASAISANTFWTSNPVATYSATALGNSIANPNYIIQDLSSTCASVTIPCPALDQRHNYTITARATGGTTNAVVMLQSIYQLNAP